MSKPVRLRELARKDVEAAIDRDVQEAGADVAQRFVDGTEEAYRKIATRPATGSPRFGHELNLPGLRARKLSRFPHLIFYVERADHIEVWRVLHAQRDIATWLGSGRQ